MKTLTNQMSWFFLLSLCVLMMGKRAAAQDEVYKWEPLLYYQYDVIKGLHSPSILLSKTRYDWGDGRKSFFGRNAKVHGMARNIGVGITAIKLEEWERVPFVHWHMQHYINPVFNVTGDHRLYYDFEAKKFAWHFMFGVEYGFVGLNIGYGFSQETPLYEQLGSFHLGANVVFGYHKMKVFGKGRKELKRRKEKEKQEKDKEKKDSKSTKSTN